MNTFSPIGDTVNVAVTATAQTLTLTSPGAGTGNATLRLANKGSETVFFHFLATATLSNGVPILPNTVEVFDLGGLTSLSVIAAATGSTLYATTGVGD